MGGRRFLRDVLAILSAALILLAVLAAFAAIYLFVTRPCANGCPPPPGYTEQAVVVVHDMQPGDTLKNGNWQYVSVSLPAATAQLYFTPTQRSLFLGHSVTRHLLAGELLGKSDVAVLQPSPSPSS